MRQGDSHETAGSGAGKCVGYTRVSTIAQTLDQQGAALAAAGVTKTFSDTMSGAKDERPGLGALMAYVREGDTVVVWKLDHGRTDKSVALPDGGVPNVGGSKGFDI